jgi:hypothetical protein
LCFSQGFGEGKKQRGKRSLKMNNSIYVFNKFKTIAEACNELFLTDYENSLRKSWFTPNTFKGTPLEDCKVWFPKLEKNKTNWVNVKNNKEIISKNAIEKGKAKVGQRNITFIHTGGEYTYAGIFELVRKDTNGTERWRRKSDKCVIFARLK